LLAKICCGVNKPDGATYLGFNSEEILDFIYSQKIGRIPGIGKLNEEILNGLGIHTCSDIISKAGCLYVNYSENAFKFLV
jgi:DNA polymerase kappa